ncbi:PhoU family transcriptional regulator [Sulfurimonas aquatica]|uniref:PhoU family transcriptional regulator n=1 Tax=Sulfurimonas aquatica TaxID=2672570 RepID=A0A975GDW1_9BACT|nr:PhoU domain-containing protein [Sulfurimonas aquatica]QSZ42729.1 PhoU family transcriptional regulator [Sulfurimonas aquatica]
MLPTFQTNLDGIKSKLLEIGNGLLESNKLILLALNDCDNEKFIEARAHIKNIGAKTDKIDNEIIKVLALYTPEARDLRRVIAYLKITNELSRACSNTRSFIRGFTDVCVDVDVATINEYAVPMQTSTVKAIELTLSMIDYEDEEEIQEIYNDVLIEENKTDDLYEMVERNLSLQADSLQNFEKFHKMLRALRKSGKIASRAISIANLLVYAKVGGNFHN